MEAPSKSFKMVPSRLGHYFINEVAPESQYDTKASPLLNATVALGHGERSPWVAYDVDGRGIDISSGAMEAKIFKLLYCADRIRAKMARMARRTAKGKRRGATTSVDSGCYRRRSCSQVDLGCCR